MPPAATDAILKQWGAFGAVIIFLAIAVWWLWKDSTATMKAAIVSLTADNKELRASLAESFKFALADRTTMAAQLVDMTKDTVAVATNAANAIEASTAVGLDIKLATRDIIEELRRRRGGG